MSKRARRIGLEAWESDRQMDELNESLRREDERKRLAVKLAHERYGTDDVEVNPLDEIDHSIGTLGDTVESVDGGYWVPARVWIPFEDVEEGVS